MLENIVFMRLFCVFLNLADLRRFTVIYVINCCQNVVTEISAARGGRNQLPFPKSGMQFLSYHLAAEDYRIVSLHKPEFAEV